MEEDQKLRFVCKLCSKKFPCGKSLGGHMRSHVVSNYSAESEERLMESHMKKIASSLGGGGGGVGGGEIGNGQTSYGLRENPRKTWRAADANFTLPLEKTCKQCGKCFQSLKALCGHMASHSERDNNGFKYDHSWSTSENRKFVVDSDESDTEDEDLVFRTRSSSWTKSTKYNKIVVKPPFSIPINGSSSVSEIDGDEQEELAMCLMLLSRDCGSSCNNHKGGVNSVVESSDNNSVIMETNTSSIDKRVGRMEVSRNGNGEKNGDVKLRDCALDVENSDSGYFLDECGKAESDSSVGGYRRNADFSFSQRYYRAEADRESMAKKVSEYEKNGRMGANPAKIVESRKKKYVYGHQNGSEKRTKYECFNCKKTFKSYQALGGHRPCHKRTNAFYESRYESYENSFLDDDSTEVVRTKQPSTKNAIGKKSKGKKNKGGHVCPFCDRVFKNGQALGGHKRSHFIGGREEINNNNNNNNNNRSPKKKKPDLLDLNLPAPQEDEDDSNEQFLADY
ncbi:hypothetical protein OROGR_010213 [Orobanche gracilis]